MSIERPRPTAVEADANVETAQVGADTVFTIDANDTVTLDNVNKTSLTASNSHFT
jgi:hypothetical protein